MSTQLANEEEATAAASPCTPVTTLDEMLDTADELALWPGLADALRHCHETIVPIYEAADSGALAHQRLHRRLVELASVFGTLAVWLAILQLSGLLPASVSLPGEAMAAIVAAVAVALGLVSRRQHNWILERHRAERCRLAKFRYLLHPSGWKDTDDAGGGAEVARLTSAALREWMEHDTLPGNPELEEDELASCGLLSDIAEYYIRKRLAVQRDYFHRRVSEYEPSDLRTRRLPALLFFASIVAALAHFGLDLVSRGHSLHNVSTILVVTAAALPVLGAGIRTYRSSHQWARNRVRYRAKWLALRHLEEQIEADKTSPRVLRHLRCCEEILEAEHREWLRLMVEADWFL